MVKCTSLENWRPKGLVGFESHPLRFQDPSWINVQEWPSNHPSGVEYRTGEPDSWSDQRRVIAVDGRKRTQWRPQVTNGCNPGR